MEYYTDNMVLGYDQTRPTRENYGDFLDKLVRGLENLDGLSLMLYGSFVRGDYTPGRSDIDAVLTFPHDVVIQRDFMHEVSGVVYAALKGNNIPFQVSPLDVGIIRDGRFNSFTDDFYDYFNQEGKVIMGPDYRSEMVCLPTKKGEESTLSHNLRKTRQGLLFAEYYMNKNYGKLLESFEGTLRSTSRGSKQILYLVDGELRLNRFSALTELPKYFPEVNVAPLERIKHLFTHTEDLDDIFRNQQELLDVWYSATTFFEDVIRSYIKRFPRDSQ